MAYSKSASHYRNASISVVRSDLTRYHKARLGERE
jgi:hypothetical protein